MFEDEASFGRISNPRRCWTPLKERPIVPCQHIREYIHAYGAVDLQNGESFFLALPSSNTKCMNVFLEKLSKNYPNRSIMLICDNASWHKSQELVIPVSIKIVYLPPYAPEMNPIEQVWDMIRERGFVNQIFKSLA